MSTACDLFELTHNQGHDRDDLFAHTRAIRVYACVCVVNRHLGVAKVPRARATCRGFPWGPVRESARWVAFAEAGGCM